MSDEERIESLKIQIKKQQTELQFGKDRISKLEKDLASTKSATMKFERETELSNKKSNELTTENTELKNQITELEERIKSLATEALEKELNDSKALIANQNQKIDELNRKITQLTNEKTDNQSKIGDQKSQLENNQAEINSLTEKLKESEKLVHTKEETISSLNSTIESMKNELNNSKTLTTEQASQLEGHQSQIDEVMKSIKTAQSEILSKEEITTDLNTTIKEQKSKIEEIQISLDKIEVEKQEWVTKITELENSIGTKDEEIKTKAEKIEELAAQAEQMEVGVNLYQNTIQELNNKIKDLEAKREASSEAAKYEKLLENKDKTINILKKEISDLNVTMETLKSSKEGKEISAGEVTGLDSKNILGMLEEKLFRDEKDKLILFFKENDEKIKNLRNLIKTQKDELERSKSENDKNKAEINKQKMEINKLKTEVKNKEKNLKKMEKELDRSSKTIRDLQSEVDLESAISQVDKKGRIVARIDEMSKLRERIDSLEESFELEKQQHAELQNKYAELESSSDSQKAIQQKKTYESYILTLQTELYDVKHTLEESEALRAEQQIHIDRLEALIAQVSVQIDQQEAMPDREALLDSVKHMHEEPLLGQEVEIPTKKSVDEQGLLGNRPLSPGEILDKERNDQLMEFYSELKSRFDEITDLAFLGYNGEVYFQTSTWDMTSDIFKLIQDWKAEAPAVWINKLKYATIKVTDEILVATNVQGKGHLLCTPLDEKLFMIFSIDIKGDALLLYEDLQPLFPHLKNIFTEYEQRKTELL
ncbi:MAG: hypothetical protein HWN66_10480 [Candidatus Helarchaeota archaeon]|nr:hypothetical protein [Candidatus Helarchaeota archaeon]